MSVSTSRSVHWCYSVQQATSGSSQATDALSTGCADRSVGCQSHRGQHVPFGLVHFETQVRAVRHRTQLGLRQPTKPGAAHRPLFNEPSRATVGNRCKGRYCRPTFRTDRKKASRHAEEITEAAFHDAARSMPIEQLSLLESTRQLRTGRAPNHIPALPAPRLAPSSAPASAHSSPSASEQRPPDETKSSKGVS